MQKLGSTVFLFISYILMHISCNMYYCSHTVTSCHYCSVWLLLLLTMLTISCFVCNHTLSLAWPQIHETSNFSLTQFCNYFKELAWSAAKMFSFWRRCHNPKSYLEIWSQVEARLCSRFLLTTSLLQAESSCHVPRLSHTSPHVTAVSAFRLCACLQVWLVSGNFKFTAG